MAKRPQTPLHIEQLGDRITPSVGFEPVDPRIPAGAFISYNNVTFNEVGFRYVITDGVGGLVYTATRLDGGSSGNIGNHQTKATTVVIYAGNKDDVFVNNSNGKLIVYGGGGNDRYSGGINSDVFFGQDGDDSFYGYDGNDYFDGGAGNDDAHGGLGNDHLIGGTGADRLTGGGGQDIIVTGGNPGDVITDPPSPPSNGGGGSGGFNPPTPVTGRYTASWTIDRSTVVEGSGATVLRVTVTIPKENPLPPGVSQFIRQNPRGSVRVGIRSVGETALAGSDFSTVNGTLTFAANETVKTFNVTIQGDTKVEGTETFRLEMYAVSNSQVNAASPLRITILDDDRSPPPPPVVPQPPRPGNPVTPPPANRIAPSMIATRDTVNGTQWRTQQLNQSMRTPSIMGRTGDITIVGDWNGDRRAERGIVRRNTSTGLLDWYIDRNGDGVLNEASFSFGFATDTPLTGDFNGDGLTDIVAVRQNPGNGLLSWFIDLERNGYNGETEKSFGFNTDKPIVGDWNGDGRADFGVVRQESNGGYRWYLDKNNGADVFAEETFLLGGAGDLIVAGDWDNDGDDDVGVVRANAQGRLNWYLDTNGDRKANVMYTFGEAGDRVFSGRV